MFYKTLEFTEQSGIKGIVHFITDMERNVFITVNRLNEREFVLYDTPREQVA